MSDPNTPTTGGGSTNSEAPNGPDNSNGPDKKAPAKQAATPPATPPPAAEAAEPQPGTVEQAGTSPVKQSPMPAQSPMPKQTPMPPQTPLPGEQAQKPAAPPASSGEAGSTARPPARPPLATGAAAAAVGTTPPKPEAPPGAASAGGAGVGTAQPGDASQSASSPSGEAVAKADGGGNGKDGGDGKGGADGAGGKGGKKRGLRRNPWVTVGSVVVVLVVLAAFGYFGGLGPMSRLNTARGIEPPAKVAGLNRITDPEIRGQLQLDQTREALSRINDGKQATVEAYGDLDGQRMFVVIALRGKVDIDKTVTDSGATPEQIKTVGKSTCVASTDNLPTQCYRGSNTLTVIAQAANDGVGVEDVGPVSDEAFDAMK